MDSLSLSIPLSLSTFLDSNIFSLYIFLFHTISRSIYLYLSSYLSLHKGPRLVVSIFPRLRSLRTQTGFHLSLYLSIYLSIYLSHRRTPTNFTNLSIYISLRRTQIIYLSISRGRKLVSFLSIHFFTSISLPKWSRTETSFSLSLSPKDRN